MTITPFNAGHTLGGTIWKIRSPSSGTIIYAVNVNHMRERHLDGTVLIRQAAGGIFEPLARPDLLITDADRTPVITSRRKDRDAALIGNLTCFFFQIRLSSERHDTSQIQSRRRLLLDPRFFCPATQALVFLNSLFFLISIGITLGCGIPYAYYHVPVERC